MCCDLIRTELIAVDKENITKRNWFIDPCLKKKEKSLTRRGFSGY